MNESSFHLLLLLQFLLPFIFDTKILFLKNRINVRDKIHIYHTYDFIQFTGQRSTSHSIAIDVDDFIYIMHVCSDIHSF